MLLSYLAKLYDYTNNIEQQAAIFEALRQLAHVNDNNIALEEPFDLSVKSSSGSSLNSSHNNSSVGELSASLKSPKRCLIERYIQQQQSPQPLHPNQSNNMVVNPMQAYDLQLQQHHQLQHHHHHHHQLQQHTQLMLKQHHLISDDDEEDDPKKQATHKHQPFNVIRDDDNNFCCSYCAKKYTSVGALKMHIKTHTLPCQCPTCGKQFSRPWLLQGHMRTHTGEKPYKCNVCHRAFADRSNLRAHLQTHAQVKKYSCKCCSKTFSRASLLSKHEDHCLK